jgi:hypothetical protein
MWPTGARGDAPVHLANVVAGLIGARLGVVDAAAAKARGMYRRMAAGNALRELRKACGAQAHGEEVVERDSYG